MTRQHPDLLAHRTTLALAYLRAGNPSAAAQLYKGVNIQWKSAPPGWRAGYAAVLAANAQMATANTADEWIGLIESP